MYPDEIKLERLRRDAVFMARRRNSRLLKQLINDERGLSRELKLLEAACRRYREECNAPPDPELEDSREEYDIRLTKVREALYSLVYPGQGEQQEKP